MKTRKVSIGITSRVLGLAALGLGLMAGRMEAQTNQSSDLTNAPATPTSVPLPPAPDVIAAPATPTPSPQPAPAAPTLSPEVKLSKGASDVARFAQGGLSDDVMIAYISNANGKFNLGSDQIVYLNDLGVSGNVIKAMIQRDTTLDGMAQAYANSLNQPPSPVAPVDYSTNPPPPMVDDTQQMPPYDPNAYLPNDDVNYFYGSLAPYGSWFVEPGVGVCWQPVVCIGNHDWRPYCDRGRWVFSDCGWYWQSDYSWGWAPFHYGRWFNHPRHGWVWCPDRTWGPAWVSWRASGEYCGWAPLPPGARYLSGRGIVSGRVTRPGELEFGLRQEHYTFIPISRMSDYAPGRYAAASWQRDEICNQTHVITHLTEQNHRVVMGGVDPNLVARLSGTEIRRAEIRDVNNTTGRGQPDRLGKSGGSVVIYRGGPPTSAPQARPGAVHNFTPGPRPAPTPGTTFRGSDSGKGNYPNGSLVIHGNTLVTEPAQRPLPNMDFSYLRHQPQQPALEHQITPTVRPTFNYSQNSYGEERQPARSSYTVVHGFAHPVNSIPSSSSFSSSGSGVSVTSLPGRYSASQHFSSSSSSSPYQVFSSPSRHAESERVENNSHNVPGRFSAAERLDNTPSSHHESDHSFAPSHSHFESAPPPEFHSHVESHISESHSSYSPPAPPHVTSSGGISSGRK